MRAVEGASNIPATTVNERTLAPNPDIQTSANKIAGIAIIASAVRIKNSSVQPFKIPAAKPQAVPIIKAIVVATKAISKVILPPYKIRENKSLPRSSVPLMCAQLGGLNGADNPISKGSYGAKKFANRHAIIIINIQS